MEMDGDHVPMSPQTALPTPAERIRRHVENHTFQRFAFASFVLWTGGCLLLFILFAAGNPRPVLPAMLAMTVPVIPAVLIWIVYLPLVNWRVARALRTTASAGAP
jgi:predicted PurR-regulated permease PerM